MRERGTSDREEAEVEGKLLVSLSWGSGILGGIDRAKRICPSHLVAAGDFVSEG